MQDSRVRYVLATLEICPLFAKDQESSDAQNAKQGHGGMRWCTTGVEKVGCKPQPPSRIYVLPAKRSILRVGDAGFEPATSAV